MIRALVRVVCILTLFPSSNAAPYGAYKSDACWGDWHGANFTLFPSETLVLPSVTSSVSLPVAPSSTYLSASSSDAVLPATTPLTVVEAPASSNIVITSSSVASAVTSETPSSTSDSDEQAWLDGHNSLRRQHNASDLTWSDSLASVAQSWADGCVFEHSGGEYGENLYAGTGNVSPSDATIAWGAEASDYDPSNPTYSHFTQMVWKATKELGCARASCDGIFDASYGKATYFVCEYNPPGNVIGQFDENVQV